MKSSGFTLIEILVVVVAELAGALTPSAASAAALARARLNSCARCGYVRTGQLGGRGIGVSLVTHGYQFSVSNRAMGAGANRGIAAARHADAPVLTRDGRRRIADKAPDKPQLCFASGEPRRSGWIWLGGASPLPAWRDERRSALAWVDARAR